MASAIRSCTPVLAFRSRRPKKNAAPTTTGMTASVVAISCGWVSASSATPPTRKRTCRDVSEIQVLSSDWSTPRSAERRLVSSPVRRSVKKPGERRIRCANTSSRIFATTRSVVEVRRKTCTKFITPCTAKSPSRRRAMRSSRRRSWSRNAASSRWRTTCGKASPTAAATTRQKAATTNRPTYGRTRGRMRPSGFGDCSRRGPAAVLGEVIYSVRVRSMGCQLSAERRKVRSDA
jgi:hypothetical protein